MTISFEEAYTARDIRQDTEQYTIEATFIVTTDTPGEIVDEGTVRTFAINNMPLVLDGIPRQEITAIEFINPDFYRVKLFYRSLEPLDEEDEPISEGPVDSFDTTGGTETVTYGLQRVAAAGKPSAELGAAINYDGQNVNGVEITVPRYTFSTTLKLADSLVTEAFRESIYKSTGTTNVIPFQFFKENEVLFLGAVGTKTVTFDDIEDEWEITFNFQGQRGRENIVFNQGLEDEFTIATKEGWDYIWVQYEDKEDAGQGKVVKKAVAAYVIKVYPVLFVPGQFFIV